MYYSKDDLIEKLGLSVRSLNALQDAGIRTMNQLLGLRDNELRAIKNLGVKSIEEIQTKRLSISIFDADPIDKPSNYSDRSYTFRGADGIVYQDLPIEELGLSNRSFNSLKRIGVSLFSEIINIPEVELFGIPNMGVKSVSEIIQLQNTHILIPIKDMEINSNENDYNEQLKLNQVNNFISKELSSVLGISFEDIFVQIMPHLKEYSNKYALPENYQAILEEKILWQHIISASLIAQGIQSKILALIYKEKYGCTKEGLMQALPHSILQPEIIDSQLLNLMDAGSIVMDKERFYAKRMTALEYANSLPDERQNTILDGRIRGRTLEDLGKEFSIHKERVRQIESKTLRRKPILYEDQYAEIFEKYDLQRDEFVFGFREPLDVYNYLNLVYEHGKLHVENLIEDMTVPEDYRRAAERIVFKNYVRIGKDMVPCRRDNLCEYVLKTVAVNDISYNEFARMYESLLEDLGLQRETKFDIRGRGYENKIAASDFVLWKQWKTIRYYRIESYDHTELLRMLDLKSYQNVEYSTQKFFCEFSDLMKSYDIRDEYELHNLLKKICVEECYSNINFKRMPTLEFGKPDRDQQVMDLLFSSAPISKEDFADLYEHEYGVKAATVLANYVGCITQYLDNGIYKIDLPLLPDIMLEKLKFALDCNFYLISELMQIFTSLYPSADRGMVNSYTINSLGYRVYSNYLVSTKFHSAADYFRFILLSNDIIDLKNIKKSIWSVIGFSSELYKMRAAYEIIEFYPFKYINKRRLDSFGFTIDNIEDFCKKVYSFSNSGEYFTIHSLRKAGFSHVLDDLGFESWFYASILAEDKEHFSYRRVSGMRLFRNGEQEVLLSEFIENLIYLQDDLAMDIHDLVNYLDEEYDLQINRWKIIDTIRDSPMYYDKITEKIYAEYEIYFEEI